MNYKTIVMIALALCLCFAVAPAAAVWQNGNWFSEEDAPDVVYDSVTDVSSKYVPIDNSIPTDWCGALHIQTLTHHALIGAEFTIQRINPINVTFVNGARIQKEQAEALETIAPANTFTLDHNGAFDDRYVRGAVFLVTLLDGNGGQPEYAIAEIFEFHRTDVVFVGHGVGSGGSVDVACTPGITIVSAIYHIDEDVTSDVQVVVDKGYTQFILAKETILDKDGDTIGWIVDPAVGTWKDVTITYNNGCGTPNIVLDGHGGWLIDLVAGTYTDPKV